MSGSERLARVGMATLEAVARRLPRGLKKNMEDRLFYAIFQVTRVTNDAYGWRPPPPGGSPPERSE